MRGFRARKSIAACSRRWSAPPCRACHARAPVSAPAFGRPAAARDDRHGACRGEGLQGARKRITTTGKPLACSSPTNRPPRSTSRCKNRFSNYSRSCGAISASRFFLLRTTSASSRMWPIASRSLMRVASWKKARRAKSLRARAILIRRDSCALRRNWCGTSSSRFPARCRRLRRSSWMRV